MASSILPILRLAQEEFKRQQEEFKIQQENLERDKLACSILPILRLAQEDFKRQQEDFKRQQEEFKRQQEELRQAQEKLERDKLAFQARLERFTELSGSSSSSISAAPCGATLRVEEDVDDEGSFECADED
jgi:hypothetical protein